MLGNRLAYFAGNLDRRGSVKPADPKTAVLRQQSLDSYTHNLVVLLDEPQMLYQPYEYLRGFQPQYVTGWEVLREIYTLFHEARHAFAQKEQVYHQACAEYQQLGLLKKLITRKPKPPSNALNPDHTAFTGWRAEQIQRAFTSRHEDSVSKALYTLRNNGLIDGFVRDAFDNKPDWNPAYCPTEGIKLLPAGSEIWHLYGTSRLADTNAKGKKEESTD